MSTAVQNPALQDPALQDPALQDPAFQDPALQDPALALPTPESSTGPDAARNEADKKRKEQERAAEAKRDMKQKRQKEAQKEIERINECDAGLPQKILVIDTDATDDEKTKAWRNLGCLVLPKFLEFQNEEGQKAADDAFKKLKKAAEELGVEDMYLSQVDHWDGEEDLEDDSPEPEEDSMMIGGVPLVEDAIPEPPLVVRKLYADAEPYIEAMMDPTAAAEAVENINSEINERIMAFTINFYHLSTKTTEDVERKRLWVMDATWFRKKFQDAIKLYNNLRQDPTNEDISRKLELAKEFFDIEMKRRHYPNNWTLLSPEQCLSQSDVNEIDYPWPTLATGRGDKIIGYTRYGKAIRPLVEWKCEGILKRTIESASEVGTTEVNKYKDTPGAKDLAQSQRDRKWSRDDKDKIEEVEWATHSFVRNRNTARNETSARCYCGVRLKERQANGSPGRDVLSLSTLQKVLGEADAITEVTRVCKRDKIPVPWEAKPANEYHDPSMKVKDPMKRRLLKIAMSEGNPHERNSTVASGIRSDGSSARNTNTLEERVAELEANAKAEVVGLKKELDTLRTMLAQLLAAYDANLKKLGEE